MPLPKGARMELFVAEPKNWGEVIEALRPTAMICALGTTWKKSGRDEAAFRAVDHDLVLATAPHSEAIASTFVRSQYGHEELRELDRDLVEDSWKELRFKLPVLLLRDRRN